MHTTHFHFRLNYNINLEEAEALLQRAILAAEGLYGCAEVVLHAGYRRDEESHAIYVDSSGQVGQTVSRIFAAFMIDAWGLEAFSVSKPREVNPPAEMAMAG